VKIALGTVVAGAAAFLGFITGVIFCYMLGLRP
jgi:hypothetical protein